MGRRARRPRIVGAAAGLARSRAAGTEANGAEPGAAGADPRARAGALRAVRGPAAAVAGVRGGGGRPDGDGRAGDGGRAHAGGALVPVTFRRVGASSVHASPRLLDSGA